MQQRVSIVHVLAIVQVHVLELVFQLVEFLAETAVREVVTILVIIHAVVLAMAVKLTHLADSNLYAVY